MTFVSLLPVKGLAQKRTDAGFVWLDEYSCGPGLFGLESSQEVFRSAMRRRLQRFFPIILIALAAQLLAPVAACWAAAVAISDPLGSAEICHSNSASSATTGDQDDDRRLDCNTCQICCTAQATVSFDAPWGVAFTTPHRQPALVIWRPRAQGIAPFHAASDAQARAPPSLSS